MKKRSCCVTGHRDIPADKLAYVEAELREAVGAAIRSGYTRFISGFAEGTDLIFASIVTEAKAEYPNIILEAAIPYASQLKNKDPFFQKMIACCSAVHVLCEKYSVNSFFVRNRYMISESDCVIAVYDGREKGGTVFSIRYAYTLGKELKVIEI